MIVENNSKLEECIAYLKAENILNKMVTYFLEKYRSYGYAGGSVVLVKPTLEEVEILEGFFGINFRGKKNITVSAKRFERALENSRFCGTTLEDLLKSYEKAPLLSKKQEKEAADVKKERFFAHICAEYRGSFAEKWLQDSDVIPRLLLKKYGVNEKDLKRLLHHVMQALNQLPESNASYEYLPVFAAQITGDPHYFDANTSAYSILKHGIAYYVVSKMQKEEVCREAEDSLEKNFINKELFFRVGLLPDGISNNTHVYGIRGYLSAGKEHLGIKGFYEQGEALQLSLLPIMWLENVICDSNRIFVVENPSVFVSLVDKAHHKYGVMCISGQPNFSSLILLDTIAKGGTTIYYAGDFDPEGLIIADHLKTRYQEQLILWKMDLECYEMSLSDKRIEEKRLKMLDKLLDASLVDIAKRMKELKRAGYQEKIMAQYLEDY